MKTNTYANALCRFTFETFLSWNDDKCREGMDHFGDFLNDYAYGLNDSEGWNLSPAEIKNVIAAAEEIWLEDYAE